MAYELAKQFLREARVEECVDASLLEKLEELLSRKRPILFGLPKVPAGAKVVGCLQASERNVLAFFLDSCQRDVAAQITDCEGPGFIICEGGVIVDLLLGLETSENNVLESLFDFFLRHVAARITDREGLGFIICEGGAIVEVSISREDTGVAILSSSVIEFYN